MTTCREFAAWFDVYLDGELPVDRAVDAESHVAACPNCARHVRFERALRSSVKHVVRAEVSETSALQQRLAQVLIAERARHQVHACTSATTTVRSSTGTEPLPLPRSNMRSLNRAASDSLDTHATPTNHSWGSMRWRTLLPLAAAAAGAILYAGLAQHAVSPGVWNQANSSDLKLSQLDSYLDLMVNHHLAAKQRPQVISFTQEQALEPPFQLPPISSDPGWSSNGPLPGMRGSSSAYQVRGHRVTFFAYRTEAAPLRARLEGHSLRGHVVYVGQRQGYSVATVEEGPDGFAMTSDLPPLENAELIASAVEARVQH